MRKRSVAIALFALCFVILAWALWQRPQPGSRLPGGARRLASALGIKPAFPPPMVNAGGPAAITAGIKLRPLPIARQDNAIAWTSADARDPAVIAQIAHNKDEYAKMIDENDRIKRRQLVYLKQTVADLVQQARLTGQALQSISLPGLDGQVVKFDVAASDLSPSGQTGSFSGHVEGDLDSIVSVAYQFGREAFTVVSPGTGTYLVGDPREPGEVIVKSIDPDTYVPWPDAHMMSDMPGMSSQNNAVH